MGIDPVHAIESVQVIPGQKENHSLGEPKHRYRPERIDGAGPLERLKAREAKAKNWHLPP